MSFKKRIAFLGRTREQAVPRVEPERYGPLSETELVSMAYTQLDAPLLRVVVHLIRAEGARAAKSLAGAGRAGLTDSQVREECGALAASDRIEDQLLRMVATANKRGQV